MSPYHRRLGGVAVALALLLAILLILLAAAIYTGYSWIAIALAAWIALAAPLGFIVVRLLVAGRTKTVDPVFAAIEEHRRAYVAHGAEWDPKGRALLDIAPTMVAGAAVLLRYVSEHVLEYEHGDPEAWPNIYRFIRNVAGALERLA
jgi:hypothetical protein